MLTRVVAWNVTPPCSWSYSASRFSMQAHMFLETHYTIPTSLLVFVDNVFTILNCLGTFYGVPGTHGQVQSFLEALQT